MDKENYEIPIRRDSGKRFDKRLILQIVHEVESGLPRKEARNLYNLGTATLGCWLRKYGSTEYQNRKRKNYTNLQKRSICLPIIQGRMTLKEAQITHNISSTQVIRNWLKKFHSEKHDFCQNNTPEMTKTQKKELPRSSAGELELTVQALNTMIDIAEESYNIKIRKKSGAKQSKK